MSKIKIICDSLCDLEKEDLEKYDIECVPLTVILDDKEYRDGIDISKDEYYKILKESDAQPKTSQATYAQFDEVFRRNLADGKEILYIAASSAATGTYQSSVMAKNDIEGNITVFDSKQLCYGITEFILKAVEMRDNGNSVEEIVEELEKLRERISVIFYVDTLDYLLRGGRISSTKAAIGSILNIKPILHVSEGLVSQLAQVRGKKALVSKMTELLEEECGNDLSDQTVYIGYSDNEAERDKMAEAVRKDFNPGEIKFFKIGTGIVTHSGPGVLGIIALKNK